MKKLLTFSLLSLGIYATAVAQTPYTLLGHSYSQNFDALGTGLPSGWQVYTNAWFDTLGTPASFTAAATPWDQGTGTFANFAAKDTFYANATAATQNASLNRALGAKIGPSNDTGTSFVFRVAHTRGLSSINFACNLQSLDLNAARTKRWYISYALGSNPTSFNTIAGGYNTGNNNFSETNISVTLPGAASNQDSVLTIRVSSFFTASGSLVYPTVAIDDVNITWVGKPPVYITYDSTNVPCFGGLTGSFTNIVAGGGTPPYTYAVDSVFPNPPVFSTTVDYLGLPAGNHTIMVKDNDGTVNYFGRTLTQPATAVYVGAYENMWVSCYGGSNGQAVASAVNGTPPYQYMWDAAPFGAFKTGDDTLSTLSAGAHVVTVRDTNGCLAAYNLDIHQYDSVHADFTTTELTCNGDSSGYIEIDNLYGGTYSYDYYWNTGDTNSSYLDNMPAGVYTLTVTDGNGCVNNFTGTIEQPDPITLTTSITDATNGCNGSATVSANGGTPGYFYFWSTFSFAQTVSNLCPDQIYFVTVTDANGCEFVDTIIVHVTTGVENVNSTSAITIHPNPVTDILYIDAGQPVNIRVADLTGKVMLTENNTNTIRVGNLANGMYIISILDQKGNILENRKIVKQ